MYFLPRICAAVANCFVATAATEAQATHDRHAISFHAIEEPAPVARMRAILSIMMLCVLMTGAAQARAGEVMASWYHEGKKTANGERYEPDGITCAHRTLLFNTRIRVTDIVTRKSVVCRVNDRGPFIGGRVVDLSRGAARVLGIIERGLAMVTIEILT
jgi:rare lipoprotein A